jgi:hypothetical protein
MICAGLNIDDRTSMLRTLWEQRTPSYVSCLNNGACCNTDGSDVKSPIKSLT